VEPYTLLAMLTTEGNLHGFPRGLSLAAPRKQNMSGKTRKNGNGKNGNVKGSTLELKTDPFGSF